jgi:hypothetical protein
MTCCSTVFGGCDEARWSDQERNVNSEGLLCLFAVIRGVVPWTSYPSIN